jgi:hypothetical protein
LKYIFPAGGLLKSSPNTFVKIKLKKRNSKTRDFYSFIKGTLQDFFRSSDSFPFGEGCFLIEAKPVNRIYFIHWSYPKLDR